MKNDFSVMKSAIKHRMNYDFNLKLLDIKHVW